MANNQQYSKEQITNKTTIFLSPACHPASDKDEAPDSMVGYTDANQLNCDIHCTDQQEARVRRRACFDKLYTRVPVLFQYSRFDQWLLALAVAGWLKCVDRQYSSVNILVSSRQVVRSVGLSGCLHSREVVNF